MPVSLAELIKLLEEIAPPKLALKEEQEKGLIGLLVGPLDDEGKEKFEVRKIALTLDPTVLTVRKAIEEGVNLMITHHDIELEEAGLKNLETGPFSHIPHQIRVLNLLKENNIALYCVHTNWDFAEGGNFDTLATVLGLKMKPLPLKLAGEVVSKAVIWTELEEAEDFMELVRRCKEALKRELGYEVPIIYTKGRDKVRKIALSTGGGDFPEFLVQLADLGFDVYITGDLRHHVAKIARDLNIGVIGATHHATETLGMKKLMSVLRKKLQEKGYNDVELFLVDDGIPFEVL